MSKATITWTKLVATITPSVLVVRSVFNVAISGTAALAAAAVKGACSAAAIAAQATLAAVVVVGKATAAAVAGSAEMTATPVKGAVVSGAMDATAAAAGGAVKDAVCSGAMSGTATAAVGRRAADSQRATSVADRRVTSSGDVRIVHQYA